MSVLTVGGRPVTAAGRVQVVADWGDLVDWTHSWDLRDAKVAGGRVMEIPDRSGGRPMRLMPGDFPLLGADPDIWGTIPGPLYIPSSARFAGRPALRCDHFAGPEAGASFDNLFTGLTPNVNLAGTTGVEDNANWFNPPNGYEQPYWVAVLARIGAPDDPEAGEDSAAGVFDATWGNVGTGPTIGRKIVGLGQPNWQVSNFGPGLLLVTVGHTAVSTETVLVLCCVNGASSFLEINWRTAGGALETLRQTGELLGWNYLECFVGWVHGQYLTAAGIGRGVPTEDELDRVRTWSSYWIPAAGTIAEEP